jgi:hypothetical protein
VSRVYAVSVTWIVTQPHPPLIDGVLGLIGEWVRFNASTWLLRTDLNVWGVQEEIRKRLPGDFFLVMPVNPNDVGGYATHWIWHWMGNPAYPATPAIPPPRPSGKKA